MKTMKITGATGALIMGLSAAMLVGLTLPITSMAEATAPATKVVPGAVPLLAKTAHLNALKQAMGGDLKGGIRALQILASKRFPNVEKDRVLMSLGRLQYEAGQFENSIASYGRVSKTGTSWLEALEEKAWAEFRAGRPEQTIGSLKTVTSSVFKDDTKSEPYFLLGLAQLRVCDFKAVYKTLDLFKSRFGGVAKKIEASKLPSDQSRLKEIGETVQKLNLVEAEVIQRLYIDEDGKKRSGSAPSISRNSDQLSFPASDDDEFWLDEVDGYKVSLKGCMKPQSTKLKSVASSKDESKGGVVK